MEGTGFSMYRPNLERGAPDHSESCWGSRWGGGEDTERRLVGENWGWGGEGAARTLRQISRQFELSCTNTPRAVLSGAVTSVLNPS